MKIIYNDIIPFKGYKAMLIAKWLFVRNGYTLNDKDLRHEEIHSRQQMEMLLVFFLLWYGVEWLLRLLLTFDTHKAYRAISFEREAYANEGDENYLTSRKHYAWLRYIFKSNN